MSRSGSIVFLIAFLNAHSALRPGLLSPCRLQFFTNLSSLSTGETITLGRELKAVAFDSPFSMLYRTMKTKVRGCSFATAGCFLFYFLTFPMLGDDREPGAESEVLPTGTDHLAVGLAGRAS